MTHFKRHKFVDLKWSDCFISSFTFQRNFVQIGRDSQIKGHSNDAEVKIPQDYHESCLQIYLHNYCKLEYQICILSYLFIKDNYKFVLKMVVVYVF